MFCHAGLHGHPTVVKMDVWGAFDRNTGYVRLIDFSKVNSQGKHRFGPASADEVIPKVKEAILPGATIMSDGLRAYRTLLQPLGYSHHSVCHKDGEFVSKCDHLCIQTAWMVVGGDLKTGSVASEGSETIDSLSHCTSLCGATILAFRPLMTSFLRKFSAFWVVTCLFKQTDLVTWLLGYLVG